MPLTVGLVGGVASGKSTVAGMFEDLGLVRLDADQEARQVVADPTILARIRARFGAGAMRADGTLDRAALAAIVFRDREARRELEAITHPAIRARLVAALDAALARGRSVVLDVPLLVEGGLVERCDECVFVAADSEVRIQRARKRGWDPTDLARREASQADLNEKLRSCRYTIRSTGSLLETRAQVATALAHMSSRPRGDA